MALDLIQGEDLDDNIKRLIGLAEEAPDLLTDEEQAQLDELFPKPQLDNDHYANLAEIIPENELGHLATQLLDDIEEDEESRKDWQYRERDGIRLMGISENTVPGADFAGASEVTYPGLIEAAIQFQARALAEFWPPDGPAKTVVLGEQTPEKQAQGDRVEGYLNYLCTEAMPGAFEETDRMLFRVPLSGSAFVKYCYDPLEDAIVKRFIKPQHVIVPYEASDLRNSPHTCVLFYTQNDVKRLIANGYFRDMPNLSPPSDETAQVSQILTDEEDDVDSKERVSFGDNDSRHVFFERYCFLDLPGFEDVDERGEPTGVMLPYVVTIESESQQIAAIRRNWRPDDPMRRQRVYIVHHRYLPGVGFYGIGLYHILSDIVRANTGALRALLDAAQFATLQGGFRSRDVRMKNADKPITPGEWRETESTSEELAKAFVQLPYKEPSKTLFELMQFLDEVTRRIAGTTEVAVGDAPNNAPVGTTIALLEQTQKVQSGIHIRLHNSMKQELRLLAELCHEYLPDEYPYDVEGESRVIKATDFDGRIDVIPVSDPNVVSSTQRIATAQAQLELATNSPDLYDRRAVHERLLRAMRVPHHEEILPDQSEVPHRDPVSENMALQMQQAVQAFPDQDHQAHILVHQQWLAGVPEDMRQMVEAAAMAHIAEHYALQYQIQMMQAMGLNQMPQQLNPQDEAVLTQMAAQAAQLMQAQPQPDPDMLAVSREQDRKDEQALADIRRADAEAEADIIRSDAEAIARMQRDVVEQENRILQQQKSNEARAVEKGEQV